MDTRGDYNKNRKRIYLILCALFLVAFLVCAGILIRNFIVKEKEQQRYDDLAEHVTPMEQEESGKKETPEPKPGSDPLAGIEIPEMEIDWEYFAGVNEDIYSWIYIPDTNVNYPVLQNETDQDYYLHRDIDGSEAYAGAIYTQCYYNTKDYTDKNTVIYGHNMNNGSMFHDLHKFKEDDFFAENRYIYIYLPEKTLVYEIYAACDVSSEHLLYKYDFSNDEDTAAFLEDLKSGGQSYDHLRQEMEVTTDATFLTLSTCLPSGDDNFRWIVVGTLVGERPVEN